MITTCLPGERYGCLVVVSEGGKRKGQRYVLVDCECGVRKEVATISLRSGRTKSCGCLRKEILKTHGGTGTPLYDVWHSMVSRCNCTTNDDYKNYGGRGIKVCRAWSRQFETFRDWALKKGYTSGLSIDRENNSKGYSPSNCRWATPSQQGRNKRSPGNLSGYIGVYPTPSSRWIARSRVNYKPIHLGCFDDPFSAAWIRDEFSIGVDAHATVNDLVDRRKKKSNHKPERRALSSGEHYEQIEKHAMLSIRCHRQMSKRR